MKRIISLTLLLAMLLSIGVPAAFAADDGEQWVYYDGTAHEPEPTVTLDNGTLLVRNIDYTVSYRNNVNVGTATVIINGLNEYSSYYQELCFVIRPRPVHIRVSDQTYYGATPTYSYGYTVSDGLVKGETLGTPVYSILSSSTENGVKTDIVTATFDAPNYDPQVTAGVVTTIINGSGAGSAPAKGLAIQDIAPVTYNGQDQCPKITVCDATGKVLTSGTDYTVAYANNHDAGTAQVYVTGTGSYNGLSAVSAFTINKRTVTITISDVTVKQGESYKGTWKTSKDIAAGDTIPQPEIILPDSAQKPGKYAINATVAECKNYTIVIIPGSLTIVENPDWKEPEGGQTGGQTGGQSSEYTITASCSEGGSISPSGTFVPAPDSTTEFQITPDTGWRVKAVFVDGKETNIKDGYTFSKVNGNHTIYVEFEKIPESTTGSSATTRFTDVPADAWYADTVQRAADKGIISGTATDKFSPNIPATRAMLVTILYRLENKPTVLRESTFTDVPHGSYYEDAVKWAQLVGVVAGYDEQHFGPDDPITREQLVTILYRYLRYKQMDVSARTSIDGYADASQVSSYAAEPMRWAVAAGYLSGRQTGTGVLLAPKGQATRAEAATVIMRYLDSVNR